MIDPLDYRFLAALLLSHSGLALGDGKEYLIESRLTPLVSQLGLAGLPALVDRLRRAPDPAVVRTVCEAMTTNESFFFRDQTPFKILKETLLPELIEARRATRRLRIWSCAASTGQEPYTIAMILTEMGEALRGWNLEILGTDYSRPALDRAREGVYNHFEVQRGLPIQLLTRYFTPRGSDWQVVDAIRRMVVYREQNLLEPFGALGRFDLVFCRNVLIYFDVATKAQVLDRLAQVMAPDGYLFLGGSETAMGVTDRLERLSDHPTSVYRVPRPAAVSLAS